MTARAPNVVFLLTDDQRYDELGCTGHPLLKTPNIDAIARDGVSFGNFFVTTASCLPNRTTLVTGQWERCHTVGWQGDRALSERQWAGTFPMILRRAGYFTGLIGKSNIHGLRQSEWDYYCGSDTTALGFYPKENARSAGPLLRGARSETQVEVLGEVARDFLGTDHGFHDRSAQRIREFFGRRPENQPFFLYLCFNVPHSGGTLTMEQRPSDDALYRTAYRDQIDRMPLVPGYVAQSDVRTPKLPVTIYSGNQISSYDYRKTPAGLREHQVRICQTVSGVDRLLGEVRKQLTQLGLAGNTIIVYSSDNGIMRGEWGYGGKCLLYEPSIHVPLIFYDPRPGAPHGRQVRDPLAVSPDVAPTILDLCGLKPPATMQGRSLKPLMRGHRAAWRDDFFCECNILLQEYPLVQGVRSRRWKYMRYWPIRPVPEDYREILNLGLRGERPAYEELYDLREDPGESRNLAGVPGFGAPLNAMRERCVRLLAASLGRRAEDPLPSMAIAEWQRDMRPFYEALKADPGM
jgi:arylsulfatase A-like enzyme